MTRRIRLASYNVHGCVGLDGHHDPQRVAAVLGETGADVIALQEVPALEEGGGAFLSSAAKSTGLAAVAGSELMHHSAHFGNALLTRFALRALRSVDLRVYGREPRGAIDAELDCGEVDGQMSSLRIIATHLGLSPAERRTQIRRLLPVATRHAGPVALMGDINEWLAWGRPLRWLHAQFGKPPAPRSFPSLMPVFSLDRIWVSRPSRLLEVRVHCSDLARRASDHLPITATAELRTLLP